MSAIAFMPMGGKSEGLYAWKRYKCTITRTITSGSWAIDSWPYQTGSFDENILFGTSYELGSSGLTLSGTTGTAKIGQVGVTWQGDHSQNWGSFPNANLIIGKYVKTYQSPFTILVVPSGTPTLSNYDVIVPTSEVVSLTKAFDKFVVSDTADHYPDSGYQGGYYYEKCT